MANNSPQAKQSVLLQAVADNRAHVVQRVELSGSLRVFSGQVDIHRQNDTDFQEVYEETRDEGQREQDEVIIAILDTGIKTEDSYLEDKVQEAQDFARDPQIVEDVPYDQEFVDDPHGSRVAGQAAYGTDKIRLIDARVQKGQVGPAPNPDGTPNQEFVARIVNAIAWSVDQGARVITSSVDLPWEDDSIQAEINKHPQVFFITTAGNSDRNFGENDRPIDGGQDAIDDRGRRSNALLVGGTTIGGEVHPSRGHGIGVDVMVPSSEDASGNANIDVHTPFPFLREQFGMDQDTEELNRKLGNLNHLTSGENGVSFGLPVVANMVAKMMLIYPEITSAQLYDVVVNQAVQERDGALKNQSKSRGMIDPKRAYEIAAKFADEQDFINGLMNIEL